MADLNHQTEPLGDASLDSEALSTLSLPTAAEAATTAPQPLEESPLEAPALLPQEQQQQQHVEEEQQQQQQEPQQQEPQMKEEEQQPADEQQHQPLLKPLSTETTTTTTSPTAQQQQQRTPPSQQPSETLGSFPTTPNPGGDTPTENNGPGSNDHPSFWPAVGAPTDTHPSITVASSSTDGPASTTAGAAAAADGEDEVHPVGCTCKRTRCLKLYCQCFAAKLYCGPNCRCVNCHNTRDQEDARQDAMRLILARNPMAFDTKFLATTGTTTTTADSSTMGSNTNRTYLGSAVTVTATAPKLLSHKLGCKCRKSGCMKKYCECYAGGVKCTSQCRCVGCKNRDPVVVDAGDDDGSGGGNPTTPAATSTSATMDAFFTTAATTATTPLAPFVAAPSTTTTTTTHMGIVLGSQGKTLFHHLHPAHVMQSAQKASAAALHRRRMTLDPLSSAVDSTTSPMEVGHPTTNTTTTPADQNDNGGGEQDGTSNPLMLAAYAMTEFGQGSMDPKLCWQRRHPSPVQAEHMEEEPVSYHQIIQEPSPAAKRSRTELVVLDQEGAPSIPAATMEPIQPQQHEPNTHSEDVVMTGEEQGDTSLDYFAMV